MTSAAKRPLIGRVIADSGGCRTAPKELRLLAELVGSGQHKQAVQQIGVRRFPCGVSRLNDGREVLFDNDYCPLWERSPDGEITAGNKSERFIADECFFQERDNWHRDKEGMQDLRAVLLDWGLLNARKDETPRRRRRVRLPIIVPEPAPANEEREGDVGGPFAKLNKNLLNYPLAVDRRMKWHWWQGKKTRRWFAQLGDDERIRYQFDAESEEAMRCCPSGFDVNMLVLILGTAQQRKNASVIFESRSSMLRAMGYGYDLRNRRRLAWSLSLWSEVSIRFGQWYFRKPYQKGVKVLPPPLQLFSCGRGRVEVRLDPTWYELEHDGYYLKVPFPLPREAAAQNLVLCLLASKKRNDPEYENAAYPRRLRRLCRKVGINHSRRNRVMAHALRSAEAWFKEHGGDLLHVKKDGKINFSIIRPKPTKKHKLQMDEDATEIASARPIERVRLPEKIAVG